MITTAKRLAHARKRIQQLRPYKDAFDDFRETVRKMLRQARAEKRRAEKIVDFSGPFGAASTEGVEANAVANGRISALEGVLRAMRKKRGQSHE